MKERTTNLSLTALVAGIMSIITVFGGYTAFLGVFFALFGLFAGSRGKRKQHTRTAEWAVIISVLGLILCAVVTAALVGLYLFSGINDAFDITLPELNLSDIDFHHYYTQLKELLISIIQKF